jgi:hypothetical protein
MIDLEDTALFAQAAASKEILLEGDTVEKTVELAGNAAAHVERLTLRVLEQTGCAGRIYFGQQFDPDDWSRLARHSNNREGRHTIDGFHRAVTRRRGA